MKLVAVIGHDVPEGLELRLQTFGEMQKLIEVGRAQSVVNRGGRWTLLDDADRAQRFRDAGIVVHPTGCTMQDVRKFLASL